jgi:hypothetical protein
MSRLSNLSLISDCDEPRSDPSQLSPDPDPLSSAEANSRLGD